MADFQYRTPIGNDGMYILDTASWRVVRPVMDHTLCVKCGLCLGYCPVNSIRGTKDGRYEIDYSFCKGCGICAQECPQKAIAMTPEGGESNGQ